MNYLVINGQIVAKGNLSNLHQLLVDFFAFAPTLQNIDHHLKKYGQYQHTLGHFAQIERGGKTVRIDYPINITIQKQQEDE